MTTEPSPKKPALPRNPGIGYAWSAGWLLTALVGFVFIGIGIANGTAGNLTGRAGAIYGVPVVALIIAIIVFVSALRRRTSWREWVSASSVVERREAIEAVRARQPWVGVLAAGIVIGVVWLTGAILIGVVSASIPPDALVAALMGLCLVGLLVAGLLALGLTARAAVARIRARQG
jgi:hypothetical protein